MIITWLGQSCFKMQDKTTSDGITVVTDPFDAKNGLKPPHFEADIVTVSHEDSGHNNIETLRGDPYVIKTAGEFDVKGIFIEGVDSDLGEKSGTKVVHNTIYRFEIDSITITHLGGLGASLDDKQLERLVGTDILLIPVGGGSTLNAKKAVDIVSQLEPRIVIPMHYKLPGLKEDIDGVEKFIKEMGLKPREEEKLKISKKDMPQEDMELVILKP